jgi:hypothetical protein
VLRQCSGVIRLCTATGCTYIKVKSEPMCACMLQLRDVLTSVAVAPVWYVMWAAAPRWQRVLPSLMLATGLALQGFAHLRACVLLTACMLRCGRSCKDALAGA